MKKLMLILFTLIFSNLCLSQDFNSNEIEVKYKFKSSRKPSNVKFVCLVPNDIEGVQKVNSINFSIEPDNLFTENGNKYAEFIFKNVTQTFTLTVNIKIDIYNRDLVSVTKNPILQNTISAKYLADENYIESSDPDIKITANTLRTSDAFETLRNIYMYVITNITYNGYNRKEKGALRTLKSRQGDCTEFSDLFVALCRANGLPARVVEGYTTDSYRIPYHGWTEVYIPQYGWIRFEPTPGNSATFAELGNRYIQLSSIRNDIILKNRHFWSLSQSGGIVFLKHKLKVLQ